MKNDKILAAIKSDDLAAFAQLLGSAKGSATLCLGRFPLLSLCYLYGAKKILKRFEKRLDVSTYTFVDEDPQIYIDFKQRAAKAVRLYTVEGAIVSPLEMLAILNSRRIQRVYPLLKKSDSTSEKIALIYSSFHGRQVALTQNTILFKSQPLSGVAKIITAIIIAVAVVFSALPLGAVVAAEKSFGGGTAANPYLIKNAAQLMLMAKSGQVSHYLLKNDITVDANNLSDAEFLGTLNGGGNSIYVSNFFAPVFTSIKGTIKNITFVFDAQSLEIGQTSALLAMENNGTIDEVTINASLSLSLGNVDGIELSAFAHKNYGTIKNSTLNADISFFSTNGAAFGGFALFNYGLVEGCSTTQESVLVSDAVDMAAIVAANMTSGTIKNCTNNASVQQITSKDDWFAIATGIVIENYGLVEGCFNNGDIAVASLGSSTDEVYALAGGIAYLNRGIIDLCKNLGDIQVQSKSFFVYAGGIAVYNYNAAIRSCGSQGTITLSAQALRNVSLYGGGIVGYNYGYAIDCFSSMDFKSDHESAYFGGITGLWQKEQQNQHQNNFYVRQQKAPFGVGAYVQEGLFFIAEWDFEGLSRVLSQQELAQTEVYW